MAGDLQRPDPTRQRRPRSPRSMAPLLGLVRRPVGSAAECRSLSCEADRPGKGPRLLRSLRALRAAERFRLWLSVVLAPEELPLFERWAVLNDASYQALLRLFKRAEGSAHQEAMLDELRRAVGFRDFSEPGEAEERH